MFVLWQIYRSFGSKGHEIIAATLTSIISKGKETLSPEALGVTVLDAIKASKSRSSSSPPITTRSFWTVTGNPIPFTDFVGIIAVPHIANLLIAYDLGCSEEQADETRIASFKYGNAFNGQENDNDDGEDDDDVSLYWHTRNPIYWAQPPFHRVLPTPYTHAFAIRVIWCVTDSIIFPRAHFVSRMLAIAACHRPPLAQHVQSPSPSQNLWRHSRFLTIHR